MALSPDDDLVVRISDIAVAAIGLALLDLVPIIRKEIVNSVRKEVSGEQAYFPKGLGEQKAKRNEAMRIDRAAGLSVRAIARKHYISKTRAAEILKGGR